MYHEKIASRSESITLDGYPCHVRIWDDADARTGAPRTPVLLLHGWMDVGASWQFLVDAWAQQQPALLQDYRLIAPDWRGFGQSLPDAPGQAAPRSYFFPDYLADLDCLLNHYAPSTAHLIGHSMGANIALMYAGVRPQRVRRLVALEGFGLPATQPSQAPARYAQWLDELAQQREGASLLKPYASLEAVAQRLVRNNPRLPLPKALWLAQHWAAPDARGQWHIRAHAAHRIVNPQLYRVEEVLHLYRHITAPVLAVEASDDSLGLFWKGQLTLAEYHQRLIAIPQCQTALITDAGHMLHHDQPEQLVHWLEGFLG